MRVGCNASRTTRYESVHNSAVASASLISHGDQPYTVGHRWSSPDTISRCRQPTVRALRSARHLLSAAGKEREPGGVSGNGTPARAPAPLAHVPCLPPGACRHALVPAELLWRLNPAVSARELPPRAVLTLATRRQPLRTTALASRSKAASAAWPPGGPQAAPNASPAYLEASARSPSDAVRQRARKRRRSPGSRACAAAEGSVARGRGGGLRQGPPGHAGGPHGRHKAVSRLSCPWAPVATFSGR